jgi:hypothetical protein
MELAIIAGIGLVGYHMARGGAEPRPSADERKSVRRRANAYPAPAGGDAARQVRRYEDAARRRWDQSLQPHLTGIVSPNTARDLQTQQPFFRSARSQHTNDAMKQRRMEMFTGAENAASSATGTWRHKSEVAQAHPQNAVPVTSAGTTGNPMSVADSSRFVVNPRHHNVSPVPQVRVGPGLGLDARADATDGFHPMVRVLPINVGEYRKNNLPGGANHGFSHVASGTRRQAVAKNLGDKPVATSCNRKIERSRAAYTAPAAQPDAPRDAVGRLTGHYYAGGPGATGVVAKGGHMAHELQETRDKPDHYVSTPAMNAAAATHGVGTYAVGTLDTARFASQQREQTGGFGFVHNTAANARTAAAGVIVPPTLRDMTPIDGLRHALPKAVTENTQTRPMHAPQDTLKQHLVSKGQVLNVASAAKATSAANAERQYLDRDAKRAAQVVGFAPHPGRMNVFESTAHVGNARMRDDDTVQGCVLSHGLMKSATRGIPDVGSLTSNYNKLQTANPHGETLDIARRQLAANDLAIPSYSS